MNILLFCISMLLMRFPNGKITIKSIREIKNSTNNFTYTFETHHHIWKVNIGPHYKVPMTQGVWIKV